MTGLSINKKGMTMLMINAVAVKLFLTFPRALVINSGNAAWIQSVYVSLIALAVFALTARLYGKCGDKDIIDIAEMSGGKVLRIITGAVSAAVLILNISMSVRIFPESIKLYLLPSTPPELILLLLGAGVFAAAVCGIEAVARLHALFIPFSAVIMLLFFFCVLPWCRPENLFPIMGLGTYNIFARGFNRISIFSDIFLLNFLLPYAENRQSAYRSGYTAVIAGGILAAVISLIYCMVYPYPVSSEFIMPVYQLTRLVKIGEFFQRAEAVFEFVWSIATMLYISIYACVVCMILRKTFDLKYYKPIVIPVITIIFSAAFMPASVTEMFMAEDTIKTLVYPFAFLLPIVFAVIYNTKFGGHKT